MQVVYHAIQTDVSVDVHAGCAAVLRRHQHVRRFEIRRRFQIRFDSRHIHIRIRRAGKDASLQRFQGFAPLLRHAVVPWKRKHGDALPRAQGARRLQNERDRIGDRLHQAADRKIRFRNIADELHLTDSGIAAHLLRRLAELKVGKAEIVVAPLRHGFKQPIHARPVRHDVLHEFAGYADEKAASRCTVAIVVIEGDHAVSALPRAVRLCVCQSRHEQQRGTYECCKRFPPASTHGHSSC